MSLDAKEQDVLGPSNLIYNFLKRELTRKNTVSQVYYTHRLQFYSFYVQKSGSFDHDHLHLHVPFCGSIQFHLHLRVRENGHSGQRV